jgi:G3E family GTPase
MVPVIVLTGFLGSGKTTLLNRLFRERPPGRGRFAIVVNELGSIGIDADLLPEEATRQVELPGGCICCALVEDLKTTLEELIESAPDLECIIIETTGVADPMPISWTLAAEPLDVLVRLAAVVTVVDPHHHGQSRGQSPSVDAQVRYADLIVLSKLDEVQLSDELRRSLRELNPIAPIIEQAPARVAGALWAYLDDPDLGNRAAGPRQDHSHAHADGDAGFDSVAVAAGDTYDLEELVSALEELPPGVIRLKGIVRAIDAEAGASQPGLFVVHRVGARVSTEPYPAEAQTRVVAIGRDIDSIRLSACLASAVVT